MTESPPRKVKSESPLKSDEELQDSKSLLAVENVALADMEKEKRMSLIKAWEETEKTKIDNKAQNKLSALSSWENSKKANLEATLKKIEEPSKTLGKKLNKKQLDQMEKKKAEHAERLKNKVALIQKTVEKKRDMIEAQRCKEILNAEEVSAKYCATVQVPKKLFGCF